MDEENLVGEKVEIPWHARMWRRAVFDAPSHAGSHNRKLAEDQEILERGGVYILYRDDIPYYVGQAIRLLDRLKTHHKPGARYSLFWNYFSVFAIENKKERSKPEAILIAAFPTVNGARPRIKREKSPPEVLKLVRQMRRNDLGVSSDEDDAID